MPKLTGLQLATIQIVFITLAIRVFSLFRDSLIAKHFGATVGADTFFFILNWANFTVTLTTTTALNLYIPRIRNFHIRHSNSERLITHYSEKFYWLLLISFVLLVAGFIGFSDYSLRAAMVCGFIFISQSLAHFYSAIVNLKKKFVLPSLLFILPILSTIAYFYKPIAGDDGLLVMFLAGSVLQCITLFALLAYQHKSFLSFPFSKPSLVRPGLKTWLWLCLATLYFPASSLINVQLSAQLQEGAVSIVNYAFRIPFAVSNVMIFAFWTVALPTTEFKKNHAFLNMQIYQRLFKVFVVSLLLSFGGVVFSELFVKVLYGQGDGLSVDQLALINKLQIWYFWVMAIQVTMSLLIRYLHIMGEAKFTIISGFIGLATQVGFFYAKPDSIEMIPWGFIANSLLVFTLLLLFTWKKFNEQKTQGQAN